MNHYVKLVNGLVQGYPKPLSNSPSESPNSSWSDDQLKKNDYVLVDITYDRVKENIDLDNPMVDGNIVTYKVTPKSQEEVLDGMKHALIDRIKGELGEEVRHRLEIDCTELFLCYEDFCTSIMSANTKEELSSLTFEWSQC